MSDKKQTAVEWLETQIKTSKYFYKLMEDINSRSTVAQSDIIEQAKEMEKEQIIRAHTNGWNKGLENNFISSQEYYNETFKNTKNEKI